MKKKLTTFEACGIVEGFDGEEHTNEEIKAAWQSLIDSGVVWQLQGWYGRQASDLITQGICHAYKADVLKKINAQ